MEKLFKKAFLKPIIFIMLLLCFAALSAKSIIVEENPDLENALIIDGIRMDLAADFSDSLFSGDVIYRFEPDAKKTPKNSQTSVAPNKAANTAASSAASKGKTPVNTPKQVARTSAKASLVEELRANDARWHLTSYTIKAKDNLWSIARKFETDHKLIIQANNIKNPSHLLENRTILVPNRLGTYYNVKKGDTLNSISQRYKVDKEQIVFVNGIRGDLIRIGQKLFIPGAKEPVAPRVEQQKNVIAKNTNTKAAKVKPQVKLTTFAWPVRGKITSGFGNRKDPFDGTRKFHGGIDISVKEGTPIKAAKAGSVIFSGWKDGYGNTVIMRHEDGYITVYAHNLKATVEEGASVKQGQVIALSGQTGAVTGPHLHFEIRKYLTVLDPIRFLR
ncbi:MAG: M23 family metallopeptidase [Leptospirales bacterium]|nr:M23 family metallopeptidase [Leptospirales bacterium]